MRPEFYRLPCFYSETERGGAGAGWWGIFRDSSWVRLYFVLLCFTKHEEFFQIQTPEARPSIKAWVILFLLMLLMG